jgi:hypothetical protein
VDHAQERPERELAADLAPRAQLFPCPAVHPDLASLAAFPAPDEHGAAAAVKIALLESERFADPQPRAPQQDDQRAKPGDRRGGRRPRMMAMISSTVGGSAGYSSPLLRGGRPR